MTALRPDSGRLGFPSDYLEADRQLYSGSEHRQCSISRVVSGP